MGKPRTAEAVFLVAVGGPLTSLVVGAAAPGVSVGLNALVRLGGADGRPSRRGIRILVADGRLLVGIITARDIAGLVQRHSLHGTNNGLSNDTET
ncbi:hypothetical protein [Streptomyces sp. NPDC000410]|uniref:hypothetical protein n=1 Tax=Streptomyces sp. NPDC000410 TaxID=3154254 RepID=UPI0033269BC9